MYQNDNIEFNYKHTKSLAFSTTSDFSIKFTEVRVDELFMFISFSKTVCNFARLLMSEITSKVFLSL